MATKILLTGFEPFGGDQRNPSIDAVHLVEKEFDVAGCELVTAQLPVEFAGTRTMLSQLIEENDPDIVVCVGLAAGRTDISFERVAINLADARIPDNSGAQPVDEELITDASNALFATLPVKRAVSVLLEAEIPASVSYTAGTYVCNAAMFGVLHDLKDSGAWGGFVHVPMAYGATATMSVQEIGRGLLLALETFADAYKSGERDLLVAMGTEY